jgi:CxxC-x17-CxxC domain-containing protein
MQTEFVDRLLTCVDCRSQFVFTAGEQIFFLDKQFKNDPKRCKPCKAKRAALGARAGSGQAPAGAARTETRTECSECHIETTVPFKPTQGRPVLCRQCFQGKRVAAVNGSGAVLAAAPGYQPVGPGFQAGAPAYQAAAPGYEAAAPQYEMSTVSAEANTDAILQPQA